MLIFTVPISRLMHAPVEAFDDTVLYVRICSTGTIFIVAYNVICGIFRGLGDSKTPLITVSIALQDGLVNLSFLAITTIVNSLDVITSAVAEKLAGFIMLVS